MTPCHWTGRGKPRGVGPKHDGPCDECEECQETHCRICASEHVSGTVVAPDGELVDIQTCPKCIGATRADLADVATLYGLLPDQAIHHATAAIPGGNATVMLAPGSGDYAIAQARAIIAAVDYVRAEEGRTLTDAELAVFTVDESTTDPVPPLLTLATWEDDWRLHRGDNEGPRASIGGCVDYLSRVLHQVAQTHDAFDEFVSDIRRTRARLEATLVAGNRAHEGVKCLNEDCGALLRQPYARPQRCMHSTAARSQFAAWLTYDVPPSAPQVRAAREPCGRTGCDQGGRRDDWRCPACKRRYSDEDYRKAVAEEHNEQRPLMTGPEIAKALGILPGRIRLWAHLGYLDVAGLNERKRKLYDLRLARALAMQYGVAC